VVTAAMVSAGNCVAAKTVVITESDAGREVRLARGVELDVRLDAQPGTGFRWVISHADPAVLEAIEGAVFESAPKAPPGAQATQLLRFRVVGCGETDLKLVYVRPWAKDAPPAKTFLTRLSVR
jgi:inhibitor of cysteine peptidase